MTAPAAKPQPLKPDEQPEARERAYDAGDPDQVRRKKARAAELERKRVSGLKGLMNKPEGRLWMHQLLGFCGVGRTSFTGNSETFYREGHRNVALKIEADLMAHAKEEYFQMLREADENAL